MEQMYLIEIFIDSVTIYLSEEDENSSANKNLIVKTKFGPKVQFIIKEGQMSKNEEQTDDIVKCDKTGKKKFSRTIRAGKSLLFPSYPDTILQILNKFPLEIEVWNDDEKEEPIFVGIGNMHWDTEFFFMLKETTDTCELHEPLAIKQVTTLYKECCCSIAGEISFIVRISALGDIIITEFQQLMKDPNTFVFRTNKAPSMFECKRIEGDDPNFCMIGSLYETTTLENPDLVNNAHHKIEICTELESCGKAGDKANHVCEHPTPGGTEKPSKKTYSVDKIRMGDITGPCGNTNCTLAHKVKNYIRAMDSYKKQAGALPTSEDNKTKKVCGTCSCKDDRYHRDSCPSKMEQPPKKDKCGGCGGLVPPGETCNDKKNKMYGTGLTPRHSDTHINYMFSVTKIPVFKQSQYGRDFIEENLGPQFNTNSSSTSKPSCSCCKLALTETQHAGCNTNNLLTSNMSTACNKISTRSFGTQQIVYNVTDITESQRKVSVYNCTEVPEDKECRCSPTKPTPPCNTFDCECLTEVQNVAARKKHKPFCPLYKHKPNCPVTMIDEEQADVNEYEDAEAEPLPYGLPPIQLGPCPILGRPCTVPDGFSRMYKTAAMPNLPPSYNDAGRVCCSKEYERIKKALKEYLKNHKDNDFRCINQFNVDTERRCCDKEQQLLSLMGKACCGSHKMAIQEKFKDK